MKMHRSLGGRALSFLVAACLLSCMPAFQQADIEEFLDDGLSRKVIYDGNGNTGGAAPVAVVCRLATTVVVDSSGTLAKTDYDFSSWNTAANGSGASYAPGDSLTIPATDVTLYAQWAKRSPGPDPDPGVTIVDGSNLGSALAADPDGDFLLTEDVDTTVDGDWTPVGTLATPFTGTFDGGGHTVTIQITGTEDFAGFFGYIGPDGTVRGLTVAGTVSGSTNAGGITGFNSGLISGCISTADVSGTLNVGGVVGQNGYESGIIEFCASSGTVTALGLGGNYVGGLLGENSNNAVVRYCYSVGTVVGTGTYVGGLVGHNWYSNISDSYARGAVTGTSGIGGLVGRNFWSPITHCYETGTSTGGALVGENTSGTYTDCYARTAQAPYAGAVATALPALWSTEFWGQDAVINDGYPYLLHFGEDTVTP